MSKATFKLDEDFDEAREGIVDLAMRAYGETPMGKRRFEKFADEFTKARYKKNEDVWAALVERACDAQTWEELLPVIKEIRAQRAKMK